MRLFGGAFFDRRQNAYAVAKNSKICYNKDMDLFYILILMAIFAETTYLNVKNFSKNSLKGGRLARRRVFVDTSALIDGRILSVAKAGFLGDELLIPRSVIRELQLLADGSDTEKRARARYGLDVVSELERVDGAKVRVFADESGNRIKVDERLLELAKENNGIILTNDFNLAKVAATEHVQAININDLAQGLRSEYLPGDHLSVKIVSAGSNPKQGVAYLSDGTMVVVDDGEKYAGKGFPIKIEFVRYLQTNAGKMMFAKIVEEQVKQPKITGRRPLAFPKKNTKKQKEQSAKPVQQIAENKAPRKKKRTRKTREARAEESLVDIANK